MNRLALVLCLALLYHFTDVTLLFATTQGTKTIEITNAGWDKEKKQIGAAGKYDGLNESQMTTCKLQISSDGGKTWVDNGLMDKILQKSKLWRAFTKDAPDAGKYKVRVSG